METKFDWRILGETDRRIARGLFRENLPQPDLCIQPRGKPYIYRWNLVEKNAQGQRVYFHVQVASDPDRPLHDHPWHNTSVILAGGYREIIAPFDPRLGYGEYDLNNLQTIQRYAGDVISRPARQPHRIILPPSIPYTMSLFITGTKEKGWGFYYPEGFKSHKDLVSVVDGVSKKTDI